MFKWAEVLPLTEKTPLLSLGEGDTPLVRSAFLESECRLDELWFKLESCNPTGSFKDRGMVVATAKAVEEDVRKVLEGLSREDPELRWELEIPPPAKYKGVTVTMEPVDIPKDEYIVRSGCRLWCLTQTEFFRITKLAENNRFHRGHVFRHRTPWND